MPKYMTLTDWCKHKDSEELRNSVQKRCIYNVSLYFTFNLNIAKTILAEALLFTNPCEYREMKIIFIVRVTGYCGNFASVFIHQLFIQQKNGRFYLFWNSKSFAVNCDWQILSAAAFQILSGSLKKSFSSDLKHDKVLISVIKTWSQRCFYVLCWQKQSCMNRGLLVLW